jgi:PAS domain S-box-containing protein
MSQEEAAKLPASAYKSLLDSGPDAIIVINHSGTIVYANNQAELLFGYTVGQLEHQPLELLIPANLSRFHAAHLATYMENPKTRAMGTGMELLASRSSGDEFPVEISLSPTESADGLLVAAAIRDITARKDVENALREAKDEAEQANLMKSRFLAAASHDLRQPLQATRMYLSALAQNIEDNSGYDLIDRMQQSTTSLTNILDALLDIARLDTNQVEPEWETFPIQDLMAMLLLDFSHSADEKNLELRFIPSKKIIYSDKGLLGRIIGNLLSNAVRYTNSGRIVLGCRSSGNDLLIQVWDTGRGIPDESLKVIFQEYVQLHNPERSRTNGLGLGLSIVQRLAQLLDHPVEVRSTLHKGSMFSIRVPLGSPLSMAATNSDDQAPTLELKRSFKVLFIEDNPDVVEATSLVLRLHGYDVFTATNAEEAYGYVETGALMPDIILSDFRLPGKENGAQIVQRVRTLLKSDVPVVFMTGDTSSAVIRESQLAKCEVLHKPIDPLKLNKALVEGLAQNPLLTAC